MKWLLGWKGYAAVAVAAALFGAWATGQWQANFYERKIANMESEWAKVDKARTDAYAKAVADQHEETRRRVGEQTEIANEAIKEAESARAAARAADVVRRELRARLTAIINSSKRPDGSATLGGGSAAGDLTRVLAELLGEVDQHAGKLAEQADAARIAGKACERFYDALTVQENARRDMVFSPSTP